jgi:hypothetical protein
VERLHQTHDSLRAMLPRESIEAILGPPIPPPEEAPPAPRGAIVSPPESISPAYPEPARMRAADPDPFDIELLLRTPFWAPQIVSPEPVEVEEEAEPAPIAGLILTYWQPQAQWPTDRLVADPAALASTVAMRFPLRPFGFSMIDVVPAGLAGIPVEPRSYKSPLHAEPMHSVPQLCCDLQFSATPLGVPTETPDHDEIPWSDKLMALASFAAQDSPTTRRDPWPSAAFPVIQRAHLPIGTLESGVILAARVPMLAGLRPLSIDQVPLVHGTWIDSLRALGTEPGREMPRYELSTPALRPRLRLAAGSRYPVATRDAAYTVAVIEPENLEPSGKGVTIPERKAMTMAAGAGAGSGGSLDTPVPTAAGMVPLAMKANEPKSPNSVPTFNPPQPLWTEPRRPASHLEPIDAKPVADFINAPAVVPEAPKEGAADLGGLMPPAGRAENAAAAWKHVAGFWKHAPRDLKLLVFGIPILLALAFHPSLKKIPFTASTQAAGVQRGIENTFQTKLQERWQNVRQTMKERAAIALDEDFRAGLDDWTSRGGTTDWAFDSSGFVRPGPLALYRPSLELTDYQLQFLGLIDKKALSWVVRAADFDDYYVVKLVVVKPLPVPVIGVTRYAVVHGVAEDRADTTAYINARLDMLYRVKMDVHGDVFALSVQGQLVDSWTEPRLRKGGVGFFTARGEASRLLWVQVTHQYDMLGRLCAYLAPYNIPSTNGGWQP